MDITYTDSINKAKQFKSIKSAETYLDKNWGIVGKEDKYKISTIIQNPETGKYVIGFKTNSIKPDIDEYLLESKLTEDTSLDTTNDISSKFYNYRTFENNFEPLYIIKYGEDYLVYKRSAKQVNEYIYSADSEDNIEGWLYGAVQANNKVFDSKPEPTLEEAYTLPKYEELPEFCYTYVTSERVIGVIKKGEQGYYPSKIDTTNMTEQECEDFVKEQNDILEVTEPQRIAMEIGSMWGFNKDIKELEEEIVASYDSSKSLVTKLKNFLDSKFGDRLSTQIASMDGYAGIKITRKDKKSDLVDLSDKILKALKDKGVKNNEYEIEFKGDNLFIALQPVQV